MTSLDARVQELSEKYLPVAVEILKECIRIPADYVDRAVEDGGDPDCGLSNHEGPRLEYLRKKIVEIGAVQYIPDIVLFGKLDKIAEQILFAPVTAVFRIVQEILV